ncbi:MAG: hypothetical protein EBT48_04285 [Verrucomicrobia bacterium]|nr:hypothetical protein [Verrucomicrobiota bacterium]
MLKETALILAGHGSTKNADSSRFTRETAHRIRARGIFGEVRSAFWKEQPSYADAIQGLKTKKVVVVPWFLANGYFTTKILAREFAETAGVECRVTEPIGSRPEILSHFQKRAKRLLAVKDWKPNQVSLLVASHGTPLHTGSRGAAVGLAEQLAKDDYRKNSWPKMIIGRRRLYFWRRNQRLPTGEFSFRRGLWWYYLTFWRVDYMVRRMCRNFWGYRGRWRVGMDLKRVKWVMGNLWEGRKR